MSRYGQKPKPKERDPHKRHASDTKVSEVKVGRDMTDQAINIYFSKSDKNFYATISGERVEGDVLGEVEEEVAKRLKSSLQIEWTAVIKVKLNSNPLTSNYYGQKAELDMEYERFYAGLPPDIGQAGRTWKRVRWDIKEFGNYSVEELRIKNADSVPYDWPFKVEDPLVLPHVVESKVGQWGSAPTDWVYFLAYTDELWEGLEQVRLAVNKAHNTLVKLLGTPEGQAAILQAGSLSLLALPEPGVK